MTFRSLRRASLFIAAALLLSPGLAAAAELSFNPSTGSFPANKEFSVKVIVDPGLDSVNASDGEVTFDKSILSVSSVTKDGSVFSLWTADPTFSNSAGTVDFSGGTPSAFSRSGTVLTIKFKGIKPGSAKLSFAKGSVLAADGKGTNVYSKGNDATLTITDAAPAPAAAAPPPDTTADAPPDSGTGASFGGSLPPAPTITSPTQPKPDNWYGTSTVTMEWKITPDVEGIRILFSDKSDAKPTQVVKPDVGSSTKTGVADGTWYFYVQFKNEAGWGDVAQRKVLIDTVPPNKFDVTLSAAGDDATAPKLKFRSTDDLSGMDRYEIYFGDSSVGTVKDSDLTDAGWLIPPQAGGATAVKVKAYDKAGNITESVANLTLPAVAKPVKGKGTDAVVAPASPWTAERILLILFAFIIGALATIHVNRTKNATKDKLRVLAELAAVRDKNDKIFSAMREEFEQMVQDLDDKPQLTPVERELLEKIKEVLEVSEELIDTGMDDLKKTIRG